MHASVAQHLKYTVEQGNEHVTTIHQIYFTSQSLISNMLAIILIYVNRTSPIDEK